MTKQNTLFNFGDDDTHVQQWRPFVVNGTTYDVSHLDAHIVNYVNPENNETYCFYVTYSHHCFCKTDEVLMQDNLWLYPYDKDPRHFHPDRYHLSKWLPDIIENLPASYTVHAGYDSYAIAEAEMNGVVTCYFVVFVVFKSNRKFRLHVQSAYALDHRPKMKKVGFFNIARALKMGRPLPKPHK